MLKRVAAFVIMIVTFSATSYLFAGDFIINVPQKVKQGETVNIGITADQSTATNVVLSITSWTGTKEYGVALVNGMGTEAYTFNEAGSIILKVTDSNDAKRFNMKRLHEQSAPGGTR